MCSKLPALRVAFTNLAIGGLLLAHGFARRGDAALSAAALLRRHVYIDTMGFDPVLIRAAAEIVGPSNVLAGSDWPIVSDRPIQPTLAGALAEAGFSHTEQQQIAGDNARRLLGI